jgi:hypothetical protein
MKLLPAANVLINLYNEIQLYVKKYIYIKNRLFVIIKF